MADHRFQLSSGRGIGVSAAGDPLAKRLVVFCHPTPGASGFDPDPTVTSRWGVHLLSVDRPGYGGSDPAPGATVTGFADDVIEYLTRAEQSAAELSGTEFGRVGVIGWGEGAFVAASIAARAPDRVDRLALVGAPSPHDREARRRSWRSRRIVGAPREPDRPPTGDDDALAFGHGLESLGIAPDDPALSMPGLSSRVERMLADAWLQGSAGVDGDLTAWRETGWADGLGAVQADTLLIRGEDDAELDLGDTDWYRHRIPTARSAAVAGAGRLAIAAVWERVLAHVAPDHGDVPEVLR